MLFTFLSAVWLISINPTDKELAEVSIKEKLGEQVDIQNLRFKDETGQEIALANFFKGKKPVILSLVYFKCPNICTFVLNGMVNSLRTLQWEAPKDFEIITVSINPKEDHILAAAKKKAYLQEYGRLGAESGWHFLTGTEDQIKKLADQVGFSFKLIDGEYAHGSALFILTPTGRVSRALHGIDFPSQNVKFALLEASGGKIGTVLDQLIMLCFRYDPNSKGYALYAARLMQGGGILTILLLSGYIFWLRRREKRTNQR